MATNMLREDQRLRILEVALEKMRKENVLDGGLDLKVIASKTKDFTSGELELLVKLAQGNSLSKQLLNSDGVPTTVGLKLTMNDFDAAFEDVKTESKSGPSVP